MRISLRESFKGSSRQDEDKETVDTIKKESALGLRNKRKSGATGREMNIRKPQLAQCILAKQIKKCWIYIALNIYLTSSIPYYWFEQVASNANQ